MIAAAPGTAHTPRAHITNMAGLGRNSFPCSHIPFPPRRRGGPRA